MPMLAVMMTVQAVLLYPPGVVPSSGTTNVLGPATPPGHCALIPASAGLPVKSTSSAAVVSPIAHIAFIDASLTGGPGRGRDAHVATMSVITTSFRVRGTRAHSGIVENRCG